MILVPVKTWTTTNKRPLIVKIWSDTKWILSRKKCRLFFLIFFHLFFCKMGRNYFGMNNDSALVLQNVSNAVKQLNVDIVVHCRKPITQNVKDVDTYACMYCMYVIYKRSRYVYLSWSSRRGKKSKKGARSTNERVFGFCSGLAHSWWWWRFYSRPCIYVWVRRVVYHFCKIYSFVYIFAIPHLCVLVWFWMYSMMTVILLCTGGAKMLCVAMKCLVVNIGPWYRHRHHHHHHHHCRRILKSGEAREKEVCARELW